jgi:hypothetical protein
MTNLPFVDWSYTSNISARDGVTREKKAFKARIYGILSIF